MNEIVQRNHLALHTKAQVVMHDMFDTPELDEILQCMQLALDSQSDGAAIAAPQVAISLRIFIISRRIFGEQNKHHGMRDPNFIFINPRIVKRSKQTKYMDEGCLSVRGWYGEVRRHEKVTIEAYNEHGEKFTRGASGLLAQVFQHETDHLNGILFVDRTDTIWQVDLSGKRVMITGN